MWNFISIVKVVMLDRTSLVSFGGISGEFKVAALCIWTRLNAQEIHVSRQCRRSETNLPYPNSTENIAIQCPGLDIVRYKESIQDF